MSYTKKVYTNLRAGIKMEFTYTVTPNEKERYAKIDWYLSPFPYEDPIGEPGRNATYHMLIDTSTFKINYTWNGKAKQYSHIQPPSVNSGGKIVNYSFCDAGSWLDINRNGVTWFDTDGNWTGQRWWVHMLGSRWLSGSFNVDYKSDGTAQFTLDGRFTCYSRSTSQTKWMTFSPNVVKLESIDKLCTITYNANGGTGTMPDTTYRYNSVGTINLSLNTFKRTGYTFLGWALNKTDTIARYSDGHEWNLYHNGNYTLYAIWGAGKYDIVYHSNYPTGNSSEVTYKVTKNYGVNITIGPISYLTNKTKFSDTSVQGYNFSGWNTKANGSGTTYKPDAVYKTNASLNLYAKWSPIKYTITFRDYFSDKNYGTCSVYYNNELGDEAQTRARYAKDKFEYENPGFKLLGWSTKKLDIFETTPTTSESKKFFDLTAKYKVVGNITLYPVVQCESTVYVYSGGKWKLAIPYVYSGGKWKRAIPYVYSGGKWKL